LQDLLRGIHCRLASGAQIHMIVSVANWKLTCSLYLCKLHYINCTVVRRYWVSVEWRHNKLLWWWWWCIMANTEVFQAKFFTLIPRCLLTEYALFTSFILIRLLHNAVRKFGTFIRQSVLLLCANKNFLHTYLLTYLYQLLLLCRCAASAASLSRRRQSHCKTICSVPTSDQTEKRGNALDGEARYRHCLKSSILLICAHQTRRENRRTAGFSGWQQLQPCIVGHCRHEASDVDDVTCEQFSWRHWRQSFLSLHIT